MSDRSMKRTRRVKTLATCTGAAMLAAGLVAAPAVAEKPRQESVPRLARRVTGANLNSYQLLQVCSSGGRLSVTAAQKLLDLTAEEVTELKKRADKSGAVFYRDAADVFHRGRALRQVKVDVVVATIRSTDTRRVYPEIERLAKGGRELTAEVRAELGRRYGVSQEMLGYYYDIASALVTLPAGARVTGAIT